MTLHRTRVGLGDNMIEIISKLSDHNAGAVSVLLRVIKEADGIDPDGSSMVALLAIDSIGLYGERLWLFYKDICGHRLDLLLVVLRGWQLGYLTGDVIRHACDHQGEGLDLGDVCARVKSRLPAFRQTEEAKP